MIVENIKVSSSGEHQCAQLTLWQSAISIFIFVVITRHLALSVSTCTVLSTHFCKKLPVSFWHTVLKKAKSYQSSWGHRRGHFMSTPVFTAAWSAAVEISGSGQLGEVQSFVVAIKLCCNNVKLKEELLEQNWRTRPNQCQSDCRVYLCSCNQGESTFFFRLYSHVLYLEYSCMAWSVTVKPC